MNILVSIDHLKIFVKSQIRQPVYNPGQYSLILVLPVIIEQIGEDHHIGHCQDHTEELQEQLPLPSLM